MSPATLLAAEKESSIATRVTNCLRKLGYQELSRLTCESNGTTVVLKGELSSFYMAQIALSVTSRVPGVRRVINQVKMI